MSKKNFAKKIEPVNHNTISKNEFDELDERWLKFFIYHNIKYYRIDPSTFRLPDQDCLFRIEVYKDLESVDENEKKKIEDLCKEANTPVFVGLLNGALGEYYFINDDEIIELSNPETTFEKCPKCNSYFFSDNWGSHSCRCCGYYSGNDCCDTIYCHPENYRYDFSEYDDDYWDVISSLEDIEIAKELS